MAVSRRTLLTTELIGDLERWLKPPNDFRLLLPENEAFRSSI